MADNVPELVDPNLVLQAAREENYQLDDSTLNAHSNEK